MLVAVIIGSGRSTPGWCSSRRRIFRLRRASCRRRLAFTRKPPGEERSRLVKHLDCSPKPGGFRVSQSQWVLGYAWLRTNRHLITRPLAVPAVVRLNDVLSVLADSHCSTMYCRFARCLVGNLILPFDGPHSPGDLVR